MTTAARFGGIRCLMDKRHRGGKAEGSLAKRLVSGNPDLSYSACLIFLDPELVASPRPQSLDDGSPRCDC